MEAQHIAVAGINTRNRVTPHELHLMSDSDARNGRSPNMVVGNQECISDRAEHTNLMANMGQIRTCSWLDFTEDLETSGHPTYVTWLRAGCPVRRAWCAVDRYPGGWTSQAATWRSERRHGAIRPPTSSRWSRWSRQYRCAVSDPLLNEPGVLPSRRNSRPNRRYRDDHAAS
jgi:hypothetical protein